MDISSYDIKDLGEPRITWGAEALLESQRNQVSIAVAATRTATWLVSVSNGASRLLETRQHVRHDDRLSRSDRGELIVGRIKFCEGCEFITRSAAVLICEVSHQALPGRPRNNVCYLLMRDLQMKTTIARRIFWIGAERTRFQATQTGRSSLSEHGRRGHSFHADIVEGYSRQYGGRPRSAAPTKTG